MGKVYRFFFTKRFNRFDIAAIVIVSVLAGKGDLSLVPSLLLYLGAAMLSGCGEYLLERRELAS